MIYRIIGVIIIFLFTSTVKPQDVTTKISQITVNGSVELKVPADQASLTFSVKGVGSSLRKAVGQATTKMEDIVKELKSANIDQQNISTSNFYSGENYGDKSFFSSSKDFKTVITAQVKIDSLNILQAVLFILAEKEVEDVSSITFSVKDEIGLRRRARIAATEKAKEKAEDIATTLGATIGQVLSVEEIQMTQPFIVRDYGRFSFLQRPNPFNPISTSTIEKPILDESRGDEYFAQTVSSQSQVRVIFELK